MSYEVFISEKAQRDLDTFPNRITKQILADCRRLNTDPIPVEGLKADDLPIPPPSSRVEYVNVPA